MRQILWGLAVCPGPVPGEHQLCSVVGLGLWSAVGTLFALTMSHVVSDCSWQEPALGTADWGMGWFGVGSEWWLHYLPWKVSAWKRALLCGTCSDSTPQPCCTEQNRQISESRRAFLAFWAGAEFAELVVTKQQLPCNPSSGLFGRGCVVGTCWEVPQGPAPWPWLSQLGFLPMESSVGKAGGQEQSVCWHGAGVLTQPWEQSSAPGSCRADRDSTLLFLEQLFRYVCPTAWGYDCSSFQMTPTHSQQSLPGVFPSSTSGGGGEGVQWPKVQLPAPYPGAWAGSHGLSCCLFCHMHRAFIGQVGCIHTCELCCCRVDLCSKWACYKSC